MVLFLESGSKLPTGDHIDQLINAEIPDKNLYPHLHEVVTDMMMHGPCGDDNPSNVCMQNGSCSKYFPKPFSPVTKIDDAGYPLYRRRIDQRFVTRKGVDCDNRYVVPYNKDLSVRYRAHINVEWCNQTRSIKYLFKYITKGPDYIRATVSDDSGNAIPVSEDEVKKYFSCRYISACESTWRILAFPIQYRTTPVEKLSFHMPNQQLVVYNEDDPADEILKRESVGRTKFLAWMDANKIYPEAKDLTYADFPTKFVWYYKERVWKPRKRGFAIGRVTYVPQSTGEVYYLRVLINVVKGPTCFADIRTVNGIVYNTFEEACFALGLLDDDKEYIEAIKEASWWASGKYLRRLFAIMLQTKSVMLPSRVWEATADILSEDILMRRRRKFRNQRYSLTEEQVRNIALAKIDKLLRGNGSSLAEFASMPKPDLTLIKRSKNNFIEEETSYDRVALRAKHIELISMITDEQRGVYEEIMDAVRIEKGGMFFVYGFGGTGKTYLWSILGAALRSEGLIVLNVASSGIAALLLQGGQTAHSRFGIPISVNETSLCSISAGSKQAELIKLAKLIIWDEAPMMSKYCFETLDRTMRDITKCDLPFGGKVIVFGGDFRQILPVIPDGGRVETVLSALNSSSLWSHCKVLKLTKNMRLVASGLSERDASEMRAFSKWILDIGDGLINSPNDGKTEIDIPDDLLITECEDPVEAIVNAVYGDNYSEETCPQFYQSRAILSPRNHDVDIVNSYMLDRIKGEKKTYFSSDSIEPSDKGSKDDMLYSQEFLNGIQVSGLPKHELRLRVGTTVMLLRNVDPKGGLCNGTRFIITRMAPHVIEGRMITGSKVGKLILIPRMFVSPPDAKFPFRMRRRQFPITVAFAMSINKSQGQTLEKVGLYLPKPVFTHGQLYVAISRVTSKQGLKILITDKDGRPLKSTTNIVYKEVFQNL